MPSNLQLMGSALLQIITPHWFPLVLHFSAIAQVVTFEGLVPGRYYHCIVKEGAAPPHGRDGLVVWPMVYGGIINESAGKSMSDYPLIFALQSFWAMQIDMHTQIWSYIHIYIYTYIYIYIYTHIHIHIHVQYRWIDISHFAASNGFEGETSQWPDGHVQMLGV